jgi:hypothetical protein
VKYTPPPPPLADGVLTVTVAQIQASLVPGIISGCVMCQHSVGTYWRHEDRFHPLHPVCALRLVERWYAMLDETQDGAAEPVAAAAPSGLTGAYARRAARMATSGSPAAAPVLTRSLAPVIHPDVQANRWWRPGNGPDEPCIVQIERTSGRAFVPFGPSLDRAREEISRQQVLAGRDELTYGVITLGARLIFPDGSFYADYSTIDVWGEVSDPHGPPLFRSLAQIGAWETCRGCGVWRWPGCWLLAEARLCAACAAPEDGGRPWPDEPSPPGGHTEPPPEPKKKSGKRDAVAVD